MFYFKGGETLGKVSQGGGRCPIAENIQNQAGWGYEMPDPVEGVPAFGRGVGLEDL